MKLLLVLLVAILFMQAFVEVAAYSPTDQEDAGENLEGLLKEHKPHHNINCTHACARRCSKASRKKICHRACKSCCARCHCVPPGTYGNKDVCPCYANLKTHGNRPKCP